ncbi:MAG: metallophosphoesterase family protein [Caldilineaceae bacterium]
MIKLAVFTDTHANLPDLQVALNAIHAEGVDLIVHTGDAVAIGPNSPECLALLLDTPNLHCLMGNHDAWFAHGLPTPQPPWMSDGEVAHHRWLRQWVDASYQAIVAQWPYWLATHLEEVSLAFTHYGLTRTGRDFVPIIPQPSVAQLDDMFEQHHSDLVFYGHHHPFADVQGKSRYINPGSLGCHTEALARYTIVTIQGANYTISHKAAPYDDAPLFQDFEARQTPERALIYKIFFGGRFPLW